MTNEEILVNMLIQLNNHRLEGHGGYYFKNLLIDEYDAHTDGETDAELKALYERIYGQAVADELIKVSPQDSERCVIETKGINMVDPHRLRQRIKELEEAETP